MNGNNGYFGTLYLGLKDMISYLFASNYSSLSSESIIEEGNEEGIDVENGVGNGNTSRRRHHYLHQYIFTCYQRSHSCFHQIKSCWYWLSNCDCLETDEEDCPSMPLLVQQLTLCLWRSLVTRIRDRDQLFGAWLLSGGMVSTKERKEQ